MNINCDARSYILENQSGEEFLKYVANVMEHQLQEWDRNYEVMVMKFKNYEVMIKNGEQYYHVNVTLNELESLVRGGYYLLDRKLWKELEGHGLPINMDGNYMDVIFSF